MSNEIIGTVSTTGNIKGSLNVVYGKDGASAYEIAVKNGYIGTETEWLTSLKGETGAQGIQGEKGDTGAQGIQGIQGIQGEKGDKGDKGDKGEQGEQGIQGIQGIQGERGEKGEQGEKGEKGDTGESGAYYGTEAPQTAKYPIWINPEGEGYDIDRNYNPQSDNPQSGKAVAEGLADLSTQIEGEISSVSADIEQVQTDIGTINTTLAGLLDVFYPIGSIYQSTAETSPATLFGGTWEQIKDVFLLSAGDTYSAGSTGGEATHTLTVDEMPSHSHNSSISAEGSTKYGLASGGGWEGSVLVGWGTEERVDAVRFTGGNQPHNNIPPYLTVYMWKRTA